MSFSHAVFSIRKKNKMQTGADVIFFDYLKDIFCTKSMFFCIINKVTRFLDEKHTFAIVVDHFYFTN